MNLCALMVIPPEYYIFDILSARQTNLPKPSMEVNWLFGPFFHSTGPGALAFSHLSLQSKAHKISTDSLFKLII